ncbi:MAG: hypothetical protein NC311_16740 [Muribaculaceae bacterium]|nr:hypothetical protein [Muribaculaceae bacterium]
MKTAAKVFIILGMVFGCIAILPLIFGGITLSKMKKATSASELTVWGVLDIFFCGLIGGILVLCLKDEDLAK